MVAAYQSFAHNAAGGGAACVVTKPSGTVSGDGLIAFITNVTPGSPITPPAGFTLKAGAANADAIYYKTAGGAEPASYSWTPPALGTLKVVMVRVTGQGAGDFIAAASILAYASRTSHVLTGVTATAANLLLQVCGGTTGGVTWAPPGTAVERFDGADSAGCVAAGGDETVGAGATGTRTWTPSAAAAAAGFMVAITPAATDATVNAVTATGTSQAHAPTVGIGVTVAAPTSTVTALAHAPTVTAGASITGTVATGSGQAHPPTISQTVTIEAEPAQATGQAHPPAVTADASTVVSAPAATGTAEAWAPAISADALLEAATAIATALAYAPTVAGGAAVQAVVATASGQAYPPEVTVPYIVPRHASAGVKANRTTGTITPTRMRANLS